MKKEDILEKLKQRQNEILGEILDDNSTRFGVVTKKTKNVDFCTTYIKLNKIYEIVKNQTDNNDFKDL